MTPRGTIVHDRALGVTLVLVSIVSIVSILACCRAAAGEPVWIYSHNVERETEAFVADLKAATKLDVRVVRMPSDELRARVVAEKGNVGADLQWGMPVSHAILAKQEGLLAAYRSPEWEKVPPRFRDSDGHWYGWAYWFHVVAVNTEVARQKGLSRPRRWADLLSPSWRGEIVMPDPGTSGTGYLVAATLIQLMGENQAWKYLADLDKNVAEYTKTRSAPAEQVARGRYALAIAWDQAVVKRQAQGYPLELIVPEEGVGFSLDAIAIFRGAKNPEAAKRVVDYAGSERGMRVIARYRSRVTRPGIEALVPFEPKLIPYDAVRAGRDRERVMMAWRTRFQR